MQYIYENTHHTDPFCNILMSNDDKTSRFKTLKHIYINHFGHYGVKVKKRVSHILILKFYIFVII